MPLTLVLIILLVGAPVVDWIVAVILVRACRKAPKVAALRERALLAIGIALATTLFLATCINSATGHVFWGNETDWAFVRLIIAVLGILPIYWLWLYLRKGFRDN